MQRQPLRQALRQALSTARLPICNILMQKSTSLRLLGSDETGPLKSLFSPLIEVKLRAPFSLGPGSGCYQKTLKRSALIWLSKWLLNWRYLVLCVLDAGFKGASCFSALPQMSLKGLKITEADSLPVRLLGAEEPCAATRHYLKNTRLLTSRERILATLFSFRAIKTMHYMSNCQTFQRGPFALSNNI